MTQENTESKPGFFARLKAGLSRSTGALAGNLTSIITHRKLDAATLAELREVLIAADLGAVQATAITEAIGKDRFDQDFSEWDLKIALYKEIAAVLKPVEKPLAIDRSKAPFVILVAGVNGTGKTTTIG